MLTTVPVTLAGDGETNLKSHLKQRIRALRTGWQEIHQTRLPNWRRIYEAIPQEKTRTYPWYNASNLVVPVVGIFSDTLLARIMAAVFKTNPLWVVRALGRQVSEELEPLRVGLEVFMQYMGMEPDELDLYRVYEEWEGDVIKFGTGTVKVPWETVTEDFHNPPGEGLTEFDVRTVYDGPRPEKISYDDFLVPPSAKRLDDCDIKDHIRRMQRWELEERRYRGVYKKDVVDRLLASPDRTAPRAASAQQQADVGAQETAADGYAEWDLHECWLYYRQGDHRCKICVTYHEKSDSILRAVYSQYPSDPFVTSRLFYRDGMFPGIGFAEMLAGHQEEISEMHNQRRDRMTASFGFFRVDPDSKLHSGYRLVPCGMLPGVKDEIEAMSLGEPTQVSIDEEELALRLAQQRCGVSGPTQGMGAGAFNKRGVYSTQGTLAVMQEGNTRTDLNISDIRYGHVKLGRLLAMQYAAFGLDASRLEPFGVMGENIKRALEALRDKRLVLPIVSSTASVNREVEKQNDLMLANIMARHYQMVVQMLQSAMQPGLAPEVVEYLNKSVKSANEFMELVMADFGHDEAYRYVPEARESKPQAPPQFGGGPSGPGLPQGTGLPQQGLQDVMQKLLTAGGRVQ